MSCFSTTVVLVILQRPVSSGKKISPNQVQLYAISYFMTEEQFFFTEIQFDGILIETSQRSLKKYHILFSGTRLVNMLQYQL